MMVRPVEHFVALMAQIVGTGTSISASAMYSIEYQYREYSSAKKFGDLVLPQMLHLKTTLTNCVQFALAVQKVLGQWSVVKCIFLKV